MADEVKNREIFERVTRVETRQDQIINDLYEIKNNHLAHINAQLVDLTEKFNDYDKKMLRVSLSVVLAATPLLIKESRDSILTLIQHLLGF